MSATTDRFRTPLYTVAEAARYLGVPESTFHTWARGYSRKPEGRCEVHGASLVTVIKGQPRGSASLPFVGLAEGLALTAIRKSGVTMQRIRPALDVLQKELGLDPRSCAGVEIPVHRWFRNSVRLRGAGRGL